ncbi:MAG: hypothetical protein JXB32_18160 [Deltaproteobacteria bacterium]|nr:hypothetical protein [Deltaproteobacteria bacterium]
MTTGAERPLDELPLGEMKALHRETHLCLRCSHNVVCGMAKALDPNLLVAIAHCLAFEPLGDATDRGGEADGQLSLG